MPFEYGENHRFCILMLETALVRKVLACSPKIDPSAMRVPGTSRETDSHKKKKKHTRTDR
jgi:hypothetical protein